MIRVRFAPSPTGYLHIGGVRTALFNFLYARNTQGQFLLRIEDTDRERSRKEFEDEILTSLKWLGLDWDEAIIRQSGRLARYREVAGELVAKGLAFEEKADGQVAVKFKMPASPAGGPVSPSGGPPRRTVFHDLVHGETSFDASLFADLVLLKSDGYPTYHLACVVDDHDMQISHVIRGDDHLSNTPRQILLFESLGWKPPQYAHLPLILGADGTPLSKRHGAVSLTSFREEGFLPEGILNYLALLGWGTEGNQEFYAVKELTRKFSLKRIHKANARFDQEKLRWLNGQHIKKLSESEYLEQITRFYEKEARKFSPEKWKRLALLYRARIQTFKDLQLEASYCLGEVESYDPELYESFLKNRALKAHLTAWWEKAQEEGFQDFADPAVIERFTREAAEGWGIEARDLIHPLRFALTGKTVSPGLFELMSVLGRETCVKRLRKFLGK